jgi:tetratricopeptide (TPR) repeat protein
MIYRRIFLFLLLIILLFSGCALHRTAKPESKNERQKELYDDWRFMQSMSIYSTSEYERLDGNFGNAFDLLRMAELSYKESIYLKERIYDYLLAQAKTDTLAMSYMIKLGEDWFESGCYSSRILFNLSQVYLKKGNIPKAKEFLLESLNDEPRRGYYFACYEFMSAYYPPADSIYLEKALQGEWLPEDRPLLMKVADYYKRKGEGKRARDILLRLYEKWQDIEVLHNLSALNESLGEQEITLDILSERLERLGYLPLELMRFLVSLYYDKGDYENVLKLEKASRSLGDEQMMKMVFISALLTGDYEVSTQLAEILLDAGYFAEENLPSIYGSLWELEMKEGNLEKALDNFNKIENVMDKLSLFYSLMSKESNHELVSVFLESYYQLTAKQDEALVLLALFNLADGKVSRATELITLLDRDYLKNRQILMALAIAFRTQTQDFEQEIKILEREFGDEPVISGLLFYYLDDYERAAGYLSEVFVDGSLNEEGVIIYASVLLDQKKNAELIELLRYGSKRFPDNGDILNFYGYQIAVFAEGSLYSEAEKSLLRALEIDPENEMYWDSLGWLYYRMDSYNLALEAMQRTRNAAEKHADIAYHYGMILYEIGEYEAALEYLNQAKNLADNDQMNQEVQETIDIIMENNRR